MAVTSTSQLHEQELLGAARGGDEDAFRRIVEPHRAGLHVHCYRMLGSLQDAEDALQETLLRAWRVYPTLTYFNEADRGGHFAAWEEPELFTSEVRAAFTSVR